MRHQPYTDNLTAHNTIPRLTAGDPLGVFHARVTGVTPPSAACARLLECSILIIDNDEFPATLPANSAGHKYLLTFVKREVMLGPAKHFWWAVRIALHSLSSNVIIPAFNIYLIDFVIVNRECPRESLTHRGFLTPNPCWHVQMIRNGQCSSRSFASFCAQCASTRVTGFHGRGTSETLSSRSLHIS